MKKKIEMRAGETEGNEECGKRERTERRESERERKEGGKGKREREENE